MRKSLASWQLHEAAETSGEFGLTLLTRNHHPLRNAALSSFESRSILNLPVHMSQFSNLIRAAGVVGLQNYQDSEMQHVLS